MKWDQPKVGDVLKLTCVGISPRHAVFEFDYLGRRWRLRTANPPRRNPETGRIQIVVGTPMTEVLPA